jgi:hypothetical protein
MRCILPQHNTGRRQGADSSRTRLMNCRQGTSISCCNSREQSTARQLAKRFQGLGCSELLVYITLSTSHLRRWSHEQQLAFNAEWRRHTVQEFAVTLTLWSSGGRYTRCGQRLQSRRHRGWLKGSRTMVPSSQSGQVITPMRAKPCLHVGWAH